jgi:hypothetical protein
VAFVAFTDGKSIYATGLTPRPEKLEVVGQTQAMVRLSGTVSGGTLDLWVRETVPKALFVR